MVQDGNHSQPQRPGAPRRPGGSRARAGGSARALPPARPPRRPGTPTRPMPVVPPVSAAGDAPQEPRSHRPSIRHHGGQYQQHGGQYQGTQAPHRDGSWAGADGTAPAYPSSGASHDPRQPSPYRHTRPVRRRHRIPRVVRLGTTLVALALVISLGWISGLLLWTNSRIEHVEALSGRADTPGTTYLLAGSDLRDGQAVKDDGTHGKRTDTLMLLHKAPNGQTYLTSLPRDTYVRIPGKEKKRKLNAAYALGGPKLLVATVEDFTGLTIDHYVEVGFDGVEKIVDAVGTVNLCLDRDADDARSGLKMTKGCHDVGGEQALAFVRARYIDPTADLGRQKRQQQFVSKLMQRVLSPGVLLNPLAQVRVAGAGSDALTTSEGTGVIDLGQMALAARSAMNAGPVAMPIKDPNYRTKRSGVVILTDPDEINTFFRAMENGSLERPAKQG